MKYFFKYCTVLVGLFLCSDAFAQPSAKFGATPTSGCVPLSVQFSSIEKQHNHTWDFGNAPPITNAQPDPTRTYTTPGTYTVTHTVSGPGGTSTETTTITVHPSPTVDFSASSVAVCPDQQVTFTYTGNLGVNGSGNYSWVFGNNGTPATGSGSPVTARYSQPGVYNVTLTVTNSKNCYASLTKSAFITVKDKPVVNFTASQTDFCTDTGRVTFTPNITGPAPGPYIYNWSLGGPGSPVSTATSPTHTYPGPRPNQYTVALTVQANNGCSTIVSKANYIKLHKPVAAFTGPASACVQSPVTFNNTSPNGGTYTWHFGDNSTPTTTQNGEHVYGAPGTYTVKLITDVGGCVDSTTRTILIHPLPTPTIKMTPDSVCPAPQTIFFSTTPAMSVYNWIFDDYSGATTSTLANPSHTYSFNGQFTVILDAIDQNGCRDTIIRPYLVKIFPLDIHSTVNFKPSDSGCVPFQAKFITTIYRDSGYVYPYGVKSYLWKFGDGNTSAAASPTHTYTDSGVFRVTVDIITNNGCLISDTLYVKAGYLPVPDFTGGPLVLCPKEEATFIATSTGYKPLIYLWDFGDGSKLTRIDNPTISYGYSCEGKYSVSLTNSHRGCKATKTRQDYVEVLLPCAGFMKRIPDCLYPRTIKFDNRSKGDSLRWWDFGDGNTDTSFSPTHTYASNGRYDIWLKVYNTETKCYDSTHSSVYIGDNPPDFIADKRELCIGDSVQFWSYLSGDTSGAAFVWFVDGVKVDSGSAHYTHIFNHPGVYTIMVHSIHKDFNCRDTVIKTDWITVGGPTAGFSTDLTNICVSNSVTFTDTSFAGDGTSIVRRKWYFGTSLHDTLVASNLTYTKQYDTVGDFDASIIVTDNLGCADTAYRPQYIHVLKPHASFNVSTPVCVGGEASFTNTSANAFKFRWNFGDGGSDTLNADPKHIYTTLGIFNTQLIITDTLGCKDTSLLQPVETTQPIANFTMTDSMSVCAPLIVNFDGTSSIRHKQYWWDFDDGSTPGFKKTHTVVFNDVKEYKVKLIVTDSLGCRDSITKPIQVLGYAGAFTYDTANGCAPLTVTFTSNVKGQIPTIIWDFGDGNSLLGNYQTRTVTYTYSKPGRYLPRMIFNNGLGCKVGSEGLDTVLVDGVDADFETGPACQYSQVEFINKSRSEVTGLAVTNWTFHDGAYSALKNPKRNYGPPGKYNVKLFVKNAQGCTDSIDKDITINVPVEVSAGGDTIICLTDSARLSPNGGVSYLWSPAATLSCTQCTNPYAYPTEKTLYTVISTDVNGCHDTGFASVDIKTHVISIVGKGGEICEGETLTLNVSGAWTYAWSPSSVMDDHKSPAPVVKPGQTTEFRVIAYEGSCIPDTNHVEVVVHPKPTVSVRGENTIVAGTSADLLASGDHIVRFMWSPSNTLSCSECSNPIASPYKTTVYQVKVYTIFDCVDSADVKITVLCDESQVFIPNTFTPNGDGVNDIFMVRGSGISTLKSFRIYNRWGEVMYEKTDVQVNDKQSGWDGNFNGAQLPPDVYVYTVEAYCENGELMKLKGDITILR